MIKLLNDLTYCNTNTFMYSYIHICTIDNRNTFMYLHTFMYNVYVLKRNCGILETLSPFLENEKCTDQNTY